MGDNTDNDSTRGRSVRVPRTRGRGGGERVQTRDPVTSAQPSPSVLMSSVGANSSVSVDPKLYIVKSRKYDEIIKDS